MSMQITLEINGREIRKFNVRRITNTGGRPEPDDVSEYQVNEWDTWKLLGTVLHRYGDGAAVLAHMALGLVEPGILKEER